MRITKFFIACLALVLTIATSSASAAQMDSDDLLKDMEIHPDNYVYIGSAGTGLAIFVIKSSVDVKEYAPPKYVIEIRRLTHDSNIVQRGNDWQRMNRAYLGDVRRYVYYYDERKIYVEDKKDGLKLVETNKIEPPGTYLNKELAIAELAFYFAYKQSFFDKPISNVAKEYIK